MNFTNFINFQLNSNFSKGIVRFWRRKAEKSEFDATILSLRLSVRKNFLTDILQHYLFLFISIVVILTRIRNENFYCSNILIEIIARRQAFLFKTTIKPLCFSYLNFLITTCLMRLDIELHEIIPKFAD